MTIPERVKDILEEIANQHYHDSCCHIFKEEKDKVYRCHCPSCLATEALRLILETGGEKISRNEKWDDEHISEM